MSAAFEPAPVDSTTGKSAARKSAPGKSPSGRSALLRKPVFAWAMYDWANSAFATTVMAGFFPVFFKQYWSAGTEPTVSTFRLGLGNGIASFAIALVAPLLGAISDRGGARVRMLAFFTLLGSLMTAALYWVGEGHW